MGRNTEDSTRRGSRGSSAKTSSASRAGARQQSEGRLVAGAAADGGVCDGCSSVPYVGMLTILLNDYPMLKYVLVGGMGLLVLTQRE